MDYTSKVKMALDDCKKLDHVDHVEEAVKVTRQINRRTIAGRELTVQLLKLCNDKSQELINNGETPF